MIRELNKSDKEIFLNLAKEFYSSEAVLSPIPQQYHVATWEELMRSEDYLKCFIFEKDGKHMGYALLSKTFSQEAGGIVVWLEELFISAQYRSQGIGRQFFQFLLNNKDKSIKRIRLEIEPENINAKELYKKVGFEKLPYEQMVLKG